jgi:Fe2+ transport system protein B
MVLYMPCVATFFTLIKELGSKTAFKIFGLVLAVAMLVSVVLNLIL